MDHVHGPNCGCKDYLGVENANDLFAAIDIDKVRCFNEKHTKNGKDLFREQELKFQKEHFITSQCDGEVLLIVPFLSQVKIRSICVISKDENTPPIELRLFINNQNVDFSLTEQPPIQQFLIGANLEGQYHNAVNPNKFGRVHKLIIHLRNSNIQQMAVSYIQLKGESSNIKRQAVQAVYELKPTAQRNDLKDMTKNSFQMG